MPCKIGGHPYKPHEYSRWVKFQILGPGDYTTTHTFGPYCTHHADLIAQALRWVETDIRTYVGSVWVPPLARRLRHVILDKFEESPKMRPGRPERA